MLTDEQIAENRKRHENRSQALGHTKDRVNMMDLSGQEFGGGIKYATQPGVGTDLQALMDQQTFKSGSQGAESGGGDIGSGGGRGVGGKTNSSRWEMGGNRFRLEHKQG